MWLSKGKPILNNIEIKINPDFRRVHFGLEEKSA